MGGTAIAPVGKRVAPVGMVVLVAGSVLLAGQAPAPEKSVPLRLLDRGTGSQIDEPRQAVARTDSEWAELWQQHAPNRPRPAVDFSREMAAGVFSGSQPTAGFRVEIVDARMEGGTLIVRYRSTSPPRDALTAQVLTSPYHLVALTRHPGEVRFQKAE